MDVHNVLIFALAISSRLKVWFGTVFIVSIVNSSSARMPVG
jgi:hypothetical protein